ncbi:MAG: MarC family protein [Bacteroidales bacterium]|jgi:multiple antibiotic resistance protein|nr:MarC family protein [Bacteroidales bacterium]MDD4001229.1 MarC family protein [Bacteroidales bacterium]MDD4529087.1 MarC family protein [Bacteroidales bacterium]MDD4829286.1 MarC family protein [Bacteroidales bacterium]
MPLDLTLDFRQIFTAFMVLFAVIDITGSIPIIIDLNTTGKKVHAAKAALISLGLMILFMFLGEGLLKIFNVDIASFAIAGAIILFALAVEMTFNIEIFKNDGPKGHSTIVPMVFPLIAGAGTLTTTLSLRSEVSTLNLIIAMTLNMILVYFVIKKVHLAEKFLGQAGIYILRKFFGVILLAMSIKLFLTNISILIN